MLGVTWVLLAGCAVLLPALKHGLQLGPYDLLSQHGLLTRSGVTIHSTHDSDLMDEIIPWTDLAWKQVHHGQLPLWNPYSGLGTPLVFNWQSASFSLPALIGYLVPIQFAFTVGVVVTTSIAGIGANVFARLLRLGILACALAGTIFELSGPMAAWLGFPLTGVMSWAGWLFAASILVIRGGHRTRDVTCFALVLAFTVYAGHPEALAALLFALSVFLLVLLVLRGREQGWRRVLRPLIDLSIATIAGLALAAPLILPGSQMVSSSVRGTAKGTRAFPLHDLMYLITQGFDGLPIHGNLPFGYSFFYNESAAYVGIIAIVLAVTGTAICGKRHEVAALACVAVITLGIAFVPLLSSLMSALPLLGKVGWHRALMPMAFALSILAAVGMDTLIRSCKQRLAAYWAGGGFFVAGIAITVIFAISTSIRPILAVLRERSFLWPRLEVAVGLVTIAFLLVANQRNGIHGSHQRTSSAPPASSGDCVSSHRWTLINGPNPCVEAARASAQERLRRNRVGTCVGAALLVCETAFLVTAGAPIWSSGSQYFATTPEVSALRTAVGSSVVASGVPSCVALGIVPNTNVAYGIHELNVYDATLPSAYFRSWSSFAGTSAGVKAFNEFCPAVTTVAEARRYGVQFVLEPFGVAGPKGSNHVRRIGNEELYRIPDAAVATLTPLAGKGLLPPPDAIGSAVAVEQPNPTTWIVHSGSSASQVLRLRLSDVPGWHATIDGQPLQLESSSGIMLQARISPGRHVIELSYWPTAFTVGLILFALSASGLFVSAVITILRRQRPYSTID